MSAKSHPTPEVEVAADESPVVDGASAFEYLQDDSELEPVELGPLDEGVVALAQLAVRTVSELKVEDIKVIDVRGRTSYCDVLVLCTATSERQLRAAAGLLVTSHKQVGRGRPLGVEGQDSGRWALIDMGDVLVHVFYEHWRGYYDLDGLWMDAERIQMSDLGLTEDGVLPRAESSEE
jgi:ribosome-associated protein